MTPMVNIPPRCIQHRGTPVDGPTGQKNLWWRLCCHQLLIGFRGLGAQCEGTGMKFPYRWCELPAYGTSPFCPPVCLSYSHN